MIRAILIFNNHGKPRLLKFYEYFTEQTQQRIVRETFQTISARSDTGCNFVECGSLVEGGDWKLVYRHYATLYFVFCVDGSESELGILDLIQVFVETLDRCFDNVAELHLIFNPHKVHYVLDEIVMGGMVLETNMAEILARVNEQEMLGRDQEGATSRAASAVGSMASSMASNIPTQLSNVKVPDLSNTLSHLKNPF